MKQFFKKALAITPVILLSGMTYQSLAQGPGKALYFPGTAASEHVTFGDPLSDSLARTSFTVELWIKAAANGGDPAFLSNKDWNNGANTGIAWTIVSGSNTQLKFNFKPAGGTRLDPVVTVPSLTTAWNHIAAVISRPSNAAGSITIYVNGVQGATGVIPIADSAKSLDGVLAMRLGQDGTGTYSSKFKGSMDELRIWKTVRSAQELRDNMCHRLSGTESGLMAYYRMDEASGTALNNNVAGSTALFGGTLQSSPLRTESGAPVGDTAVNLYATTFSGQVLNLGSAAQGNIQLQNIGAAMNGIHLYRINAGPNTVAGIPNAGTPAAYYGVFPASTTAAYDVSYDYGAFPQAITYEGGIDLYRRESADSSWNPWAAAKNVAANTFTKPANSSRSELIIGNFMNPVTCNLPSVLNAQNITAATAALSWTSGGSNLWNMAYGTGTFNPSVAGTHINNLNTSSYILSGLTANTGYTFYVQDTCVSINSASGWAGPFAFTTLPNYGNYGSGYAMNFQGTAQNEHVNLGDSLSGALATASYTLETWIKFNNPSSDPAFIGNKNWDNGQNTGILWCWNGGNNLRFNFKPAGGTRRDYDINVPNAAQWNHIAMVVDRKGYLTAYLNGVQTGNPINIAADSGRSLDGILPMRIGQDGTGTYGAKFKGSMDELRIWNTTLTDTAIRAAMCHKLSGTEAGLMAYYRMDEVTGNILTNNAAATAGVFNGVLTNNPQRIISGAAIGDTSVYIYPAAWNNISLTSGNGAYGTLKIDSITGNDKGVHIYKVNNVPGSSNGIADIGVTANYYGVFTTNNYNTIYRMRYDYNSYPAAVNTSATLHVYNRRNNATTPWIQLAAANNTTSGQISKTGTFGVREFILADFSVVACPAPAAIAVSGIDTASATLSFSSSSAGHRIEYGPAGFNLGSGTTVILTANTYTFVNLQPATAYDVYLKDSCSTTAQSAWVLSSFTTTDPCGIPDNINADTITTSKIALHWHNNAVAGTGFDVSWGPSGFGDPNIGIVQSFSDTVATFTGMSANTAYDFYIRSNCNSAVAHSAWAGPFTFSTIACDVPYNLTAQNVTSGAATISWITGGAAVHNMEYGAAGFIHGSGTLQSNIGTPGYTITGLQANTAYEVYVQDSCSAVLGSSAWVGPLAFKTRQVTGIDAVEQANSTLSLFPNPAQDYIKINLLQGTLTQVRLSNSTGQLLVTIPVADKKEITCSLKGVPSGIYFVEVITGEGNRLIRKISIER